MVYQPALDGVRALAVVLVLFFHQGFSWMTGGYVGVSVFFTLSGYLITTLLFVEHARGGSISRVRFYVRRMKRLLPASFVCLVGVCVLAAGGALTASDRLHGDVAAAAFQVYNWRALFSGTSYAQLLGAQGADGAVAHFWSLAIEEQFYWVWPLAVVALHRAARTARMRCIVLTAVTAVACVTPWVIAQRWGAEATYWSTPARLGEILIGATLGAWLLLHPLRLGRAAATAFAAAGALAVVWAAIAWPRSSGPAYEGALPLFALASAALVLGLQGAGPMRSLFSWQPLVLLGRISFGIYLYHWPVFLVIDHDRLGRGGWWLFVVRAAVTLAVAIASYVLVERPLRHSQFGAFLTFATAAVALTAVALVAVVVPVSSQEFSFDELPTGLGYTPVTSVSDGGAESSGPTDGGGLPTSISPASQVPLRVLLVGDSTAFTLAYGLVGWAADHPDLAQVDATTRPGCGLMGGSTGIGDTDGAFRRACDQAIGPRLDDILARAVPDVAVILITLPDGVDRRWDDGTLRSPSDADYVRRRQADYEAFLARLRVGGVQHVVWLLAAPPAPWYYEEHPDQPWGLIDTEGINDTVRGLTDPGVCVLDLGAYIVAVEANGSRALRVDGLHLTPETARTVLDEFLAQRLLAAAAGNCP